MSLTAKLENLKITRQDLRTIHYDTRISKNELKIDDNTSLFIANNCHVPITDQHQMYAKGIVYDVTYKNGSGWKAHGFNRVECQNNEANL